VLVLLALVATPARAADRTRAHALLGVSASATGGGGVTPAGAALGTIVFVRRGDVWVARADGTGARPVTSDGTVADPYRTPTQDDGGNVYALRGHGAGAKVSRIAQDGTLLGRYTVPVPSFGPDFVAVSPDGTTLAYETMFASTDCSFTPCHTFFAHSVEYAVAATGAALPGAHGVIDAQFASWAGSGRTVLQATSEDRVLLHRPSQPSAVEWFASCLSYLEGCNDTDTLNFEPAVNRQGTRLALARLEQSTTSSAAYLLVLSAAGATTVDVPPLPGAGCAVPVGVPTADFPGRTDLMVSAPSFSSDGETVLFAELSGSTWTTRSYRPVIGNCEASDPVTVLNDAAEPSWSPAALVPARTVPGKRGTTQAPLRWTAKKPRVRGKAKVGAKVRVVVKKKALKKKAARKRFAPHATTVAYQWLRDGKRIKKATTATYRLRKADRRTRLTVRITGKRKGFTKATVISRARRVK